MYNMMQWLTWLCARLHWTISFDRPPVINKFKNSPRFERKKLDKTQMANVWLKTELTFRYSIYFVFFSLQYNDACFDNLDFPLITNNLKASHECMQLQIFNLQRCLNSGRTKIGKRGTRCDNAMFKRRLIISFATFFLWKSIDYFAWESSLIENFQQQSIVFLHDNVKQSQLLITY